jgi:quercetin dioxygenase-like cupin family protein
MNGALRFGTIVAAVVVLAGMPLRAQAQDPLQVAPSMYKLVFENERVRVMQVTFKPGEKIAPHSHPDHYVYAISAGKLKITPENGTATEADIKVGDVMWIPAVKHYAENIGTTEVKLLVTELKEPAPVKKAVEKATESAPK